MLYSALKGIQEARTVDRHLLLVLFHGLLENRLGDGHAGVGDEDINLAKVGVDSLDGVLHLLVVGHYTILVYH